MPDDGAAGPRHRDVENVGGNPAEVLARAGRILPAAEHVEPGVPGTKDENDGRRQRPGGKGDDRHDGQRYFTERQTPTTVERNRTIGIETTRNYRLSSESLLIQENAKLGTLVSFHLR
mmetsp:Transcript_25490/g.59714  ORF Transcript_25490/g.59714 Transcript_25490/m.59714 type:complete len:118 (+) Transcript_25490:1231-1584(+)